MADFFGDEGHTFFQFSNFTAKSQKNDFLPIFILSDESKSSDDLIPPL
jgi:hypothetical protein